MSKRCCAKNCFNSVLYNKNISYFSFPKSKEFSWRWAELAGREDLKEKPISQIVKYYLCSEHFAKNCFIDKDTRKILKRNLPHSIAIPTIFKNNLQETLQYVNPKRSIEVHNIVLLDVDANQHGCVNNSKPSDFVSSSVQTAPSVQNYDLFDDGEVINLNPEFSGNVTQKETCISNLPEEEEEEFVPAKCRLCFKDFGSDEQILVIGKSPHLQEFIQRVMHDKISVSDDKSQVVCKNCENNALLCLLIIKQMDAAQEKITSSTKR